MATFEGIEISTIDELLTKLTPCALGEDRSAVDLVVRLLELRLRYRQEIDRRQSARMQLASSPRIA